MTTDKGWDAVISSCGHYRYRLDRRGSGLDCSTAMVTMVNPSTADHRRNDHSITKITGLTARSGIGGFVVANKFAFRATEVKELRQCGDPIGPDNLLHLREMFALADRHIVAWGSLAKLPKHLRTQWLVIVALAKVEGVDLWCWGTCKDGQPAHPLMLAYDTPLVKWEPPL